MGLIESEKNTLHLLHSKSNCGLLVITIHVRRMAKTIRHENNVTCDAMLKYYLHTIVLETIDNKKAIVTRQLDELNCAFNF